MSTAHHCISSTLKNHDPLRVNRGTSTKVGTVVQSPSLGIACSQAAWRSAVGQHVATHYLEEAFFLACRDGKLSLLCINIWKFMMEHADKDQMVSVRHRQLQDNYNVSESTVRGSLARLEREGYIEVQQKEYTVDGKVYAVYAAYPKKLMGELAATLGDQTSCGTSDPLPLLPAAPQTLPEGHKENLDPPQTYQKNPQDYVYLSWRGAEIAPEDAFEKPEAVFKDDLAGDALPKKPYEPQHGWIGDKPSEKDLAELKGWLDDFERLFAAGKREEAKASLKPHQHKLIDWATWSLQHICKAPVAYLRLLKNLSDEYLISHRRWLEKGEWELAQERRRYDAAMATKSPKGGADKPKLAAHVAVHIPEPWYQSIQNLLVSRHRFADPKKTLELAYHLCYFMPTITYQSEEDRLRINFCIARKHILADTWRTPAGLLAQLANHAAPRRF